MNSSWHRVELCIVENISHFPSNSYTRIIKHIFLNENVGTLIEISLKFVPKDPINNISALVQIMAWRQIGYKPLSEPKPTWFTDAYMLHRGRWLNDKGHRRQRHPEETKHNSIMIIYIKMALWCRFDTIRKWSWHPPGVYCVGEVPEIAVRGW